MMYVWINLCNKFQNQLSVDSQKSLFTLQTNEHISYSQNYYPFTTRKEYKNLLKAHSLSKVFFALQAFLNEKKIGSRLI